MGHAWLWGTGLILQGNQVWVFSASANMGLFPISLKFQVLHVIKLVYWQFTHLLIQTWNWCLVLGLTHIRIGKLPGSLHFFFFFKENLFVLFAGCNTNLFTVCLCAQGSEGEVWEPISTIALWVKIYFLYSQPTSHPCPPYVHLQSRLLWNFARQAYTSARESPEVWLTSFPYSQGCTDIPALLMIPLLFSFLWPSLLLFSS